MTKADGYAWLCAVLTFTCLSPARADEAPKTARLLLTLVDNDTGAVLPDGWATLFPPGERSNKTEARPEQTRGNGALEFRLPPGDYTIVSHQDPRDLGGLKYVVEGGDPGIVIAEGEQANLTLRLRPRPLSAAEIEQRVPFTAVGYVKDAAGKPIANAEVRVATGMGTLLGGGRTKTNEQGEYVLRFGTGIYFFESESQFQFANFWVTADGFVERERSRPYQSMADVMPEELPIGKREEVVLKSSPARLDFVMERSATVEARVVDAFGKPMDAESLGLITPRERLRAIRMPSDPSPRGDSAQRQWNVLPNQPWQFQRGKTRSVAISFPAAKTYSVLLRFREGVAVGVDVLELIEARDDAGQPLSLSPVVDDPFALPPVADDVQRRGQDLIRRMSEVNNQWLGGPRRNGPELAYRFQFHGGDNQGDDVLVRPGETRHGSHQGISYSSALQAIARDPSLVVVRALKEEPDRITIAYTLREPFRQNTGTGVAGSWQGYFGRSTKDNTLVLDAKDLTPLAHYDAEMRETYGQFFEVEAGRFVPLAVQIKGGGFDFDWRFAWYEPGVWLFARSFADGNTNATVENVKIAGQPREPVKMGVR